MTSGKNIWDGHEWTSEAREVLEGIKLFPENSRIILIVRHSHRLDTKDLAEGSQMRLTPLGHEVASQFGALLPKNRHIRIFHSISPRCKETADDILKGFESISGEGEIKGSIEPLYKIGGDFEFFKKKIFMTPPPKFINRWAAGHYPPGLLTPLSVFSQRAAFTIWKLAEDAPSSGIDLHVTHDFIVMGLRFGWFGIGPSREGVSFLGGIVMALDTNAITLLDGRKVISTEIPYWWANMCL